MPAWTQKYHWQRTQFTSASTHPHLNPAMPRKKRKECINRKPSEGLRSVKVDRGKHIWQINTGNVFIEIVDTVSRRLKRRETTQPAVSTVHHSSKAASVMDELVRRTQESDPPGRAPLMLNYLCASLEQRTWCRADDISFRQGLVFSSARQCQTALFTYYSNLRGC